MFTGIVEELGEVTALTDRGDSVRLTVRGPLVLEGLAYTVFGGLLGLLFAMVIIIALSFAPTEGNEALQFLGKPTLSLSVGIISAAILGMIGLLAAYFPARRAASIDPAQTLRYE